MLFCSFAMATFALKLKYSKKNV